jgi:putative spermidine/putrescine transport system permease protein
VPRALSVVVATICTGLIVPICIVVILAFSGGEFLQFPPPSLSLRWFASFFGSAGWRASLWSSVEIAVITALIATTVGFFAAYALVRGTFGAKRTMLSLLLLPTIVPTVITSVAMYFLSARIGLVGNPVWVGTCHAVIALPIVVLILLSTLQAVDPNLERAALGLGCSRAQVLRRVVVPIAAPGLVSAALFAFLTSFDELIISLFITDVSTQTLPVRIWNSLHLDVEPVIAAVSTFLIGVTGPVLLLDTLLRPRRPAGGI